MKSSWDFAKAVKKKDLSAALGLIDDPVLCIVALTHTLPEKYRPLLCRYDLETKSSGGLDKRMLAERLTIRLCLRK